MEVERYGRRAEYRSKIDRRAVGAGGQEGRRADRQTGKQAHRLAGRKTEK